MYLKEGFLILGRLVLFTYKALSIQSAIPFSDIQAYLSEIGAEEIAHSVYRYGTIEIEITKAANSAPKILNIQRHNIQVKGNRADAEKFLNGFRFKFLSAGG